MKRKKLFVVIIIFLVVLGLIFLVQRRADRISPIDDSFLDNLPEEFTREQAREIIQKVRGAFADMELKMQELRGAGVDVRDVESELSSLKSRFANVEQLVAKENFKEAATEFFSLVPSLKQLIADINELIKTVEPPPPPPPPPAPGTPPPPGTLPPPPLLPVGDAVFPADSGVVNVKDYGAKGDGVTDDTGSIQRAISENLWSKGDAPRTAFIYFPAGTYLVSDTLVPKREPDADGGWRAYLTLQGQHRDKSIIKLKDNASGYGADSQPKAVLFTASECGTCPDADKARWAETGFGNEAFQNHIFDLTVDTGKGNPKAIGVDYLASNTGTMRNVAIRSGDGQGHVGLSMTREWPGPAFVKNLTVEGFDYGIDVAEDQYMMAFEHITLRNQNVAGFRNNKNVLAVRDLQSTNSVPAIVNSGGTIALITLVDASLTGGSPSNVAVDNNGGLFARNITTQGYQAALKHGGTVVGGASIGEFVSGTGGPKDPPYSLFPSPRTSLNLTVKETPEIPWDPVAQWVNVQDFEADGSGSKTFDNTPAVQAAIDSTISSGKTTLYFPKGSYAFADTVRVRGSIRRIHFMGSRIGITPDNKFGGGTPVFRLEDGAHPAVLVEMAGRIFDTGATLGRDVVGFEHASSRSLIIRNQGQTYANTPGSGPLFLEDVQGCTIYKQTEVWARQLNPEGCGKRNRDTNVKTLNDGGTLWILGYKTEISLGLERLGLKDAVGGITTINGGKTELLGGSIVNRDPPANIPLFVNDESGVSLVYAVSTYIGDYQIQVRETREGVTKDLKRIDVIRRGGGSLVPLYTGYR